MHFCSLPKAVRVYVNRSFEVFGKYMACHITTKFTISLHPFDLFLKFLFATSKMSLYPNKVLSAEFSHLGSRITGSSIWYRHELCYNWVKAVAILRIFFTIISSFLAFRSPNCLNPLLIIVRQLVHLVEQPWCNLKNEMISNLLVCPGANSLTFVSLLLLVQVIPISLVFLDFLRHVFNERFVECCRRQVSFNLWTILLRIWRWRDHATFKCRLYRRALVLILFVLCRSLITLDSFQKFIERLWICAIFFLFSLFMLCVWFLICELRDLYRLSLLINLFIN